jgi:hypothetical protein
MNKITLVTASIIFASSSLIVGCASTTVDAPKVSPDGMQLMHASRSTIAYKKEGIDFSEYNKIQIMPSTVAFKKNWKRDYNRSQASLSTRIQDKDVLRIKNDVAVLFDETFKEEFGEAGGYPLVDTAQSGTLLLKPSIINLDVNSPDVRSAANVKTYNKSSGEATLYLELFDAVSGEILARIVDARADRDDSHYQWANRVSNRADARRIIKTWAHKLRVSFDKAHEK